MQTGAWALLPAASVAALYGLVRAFDLARRSPAVRQAVAATPAAADQPSTTEAEMKQAETVEPAVAPKRERRTKARRKGSDRRAKAPKQTSVSEAAPPEVTTVAELELGEESKVSDLAPPEESNVTELTLRDEADVAAPPEEAKPTREERHGTPARLFETEPFVRQQRAVFGRKAG